jgi:zinc protease
VVSRDKAQAALAMAFPGPSRRDRDHAAAQVWGAVASGLGGRLFEALRDRRSLAYTVLATAWQKARGGALLSYIATSPERSPRAEGIPGAGGDPPVRVVSTDPAPAALARAVPGPTPRDRDHAAAQVWGAVASGLGGRLFEALRDRRSLAYTVVATAWQKARGGALLTYIATSPEREDEARAEMLVELARFTREPVAGDELRQAVNYLAGQAEVSRQNGGAVMGEILDAWIAGRGLEELADPAAPFRAVGAEDVQRVAAESLDPALKAEGVVRGTGAGRPPVAAMSG